MKKDEGVTQNSLAIWLHLQKSLAEKNNISLTTLTRDGAVVGRIENDNSICQAMRVSAEYSLRCAGDCGSAYSRALAAARPIQYRCHAGLCCFAAPVQVERQHLVVLGGRAFTTSSAYSNFLNQYDDLEGVQNGRGLKNIKFISARDFDDTAQLVVSTAESQFQSAQLPSDDSVSMADKTDIPALLEPKSEASLHLLDAHLEIIKLSDQLDSRNRAIARFQDFLKSIASSLDSQRVYQSLLIKLGEILHTERASLMLFDEEANELILESAMGSDLVAEGAIRVKPGEAVAGTVLANGTPLLVRYADTDARVQASGRSAYKTKSFISFPLALGRRKVGVVNLTDRVDGTPYNNDDLSLLELVAPHLALIIDRTEWHKKAETYQHMSLTDPLTGLPNRRHLEERLFEEVERAKRYATPLAFLLIDIDHFKQYNDLYGHTNADKVLINTAQILRRCIRAIDMPARFAGDELCVVLPETEMAAAAHIAERVRKAVNEAECLSDHGEVMGRITLSIGVSSFSATRPNPHAILESADRALYKAKTLGRNCVTVYEEALSVE